MKRLLICLLCGGMVGLSACAPSSFDESFRVIGQVEAEAVQNQYNFMQTLYALFANCNDIVIANIKQIDKSGATMNIIQTLYGDLQPGQDCVAMTAEGPVPKVGEQYMLFLKHKHGLTQILTDEWGYLRIDGDTIIPDMGGSTLLEQSKKDISKLKNSVILPPNFYYYQDIDQLVNACDHIFVGTVLDILPSYKESFFSRMGGVEATNSQEATPVAVSVEHVFKGDAQTEAKLILAQSMLDSTLIDATLQPTSYAASDMPPFEPGAQYLFFIINAPSGKDSKYMYFVNPFQGYVPIWGENQLMSIPTNAVFAYPLTLAEVACDIDAIAKGEGILNLDPID